MNTDNYLSPLDIVSPGFPRKAGVSCLEVDGLGVGGHGGLLEGFGESWVGVACASDVFAGGAVSVGMTLVSSYKESCEKSTYSMAKVASAIISPALGPRMWTPRMRSVSASERNLTFINVSFCH